MKKAVLFLCVCLLLAGCSAPKPAETPDREEATFPSHTVTTADTDIFISEDEALRIACDHWEYTPGDTIQVGPNGVSGVEWPGAVRVVESPTDETCQYGVTLSWLVGGADHEDSHWSVIDWIWIDAISGEVASEPIYG